MKSRKSGKKRARKKAEKTSHDIDLSSLTHSSLRIPLQPGSRLTVKKNEDLALFMRVWELYRVIDLLERKGTGLVEVFSKYRTREHFGEALSFSAPELDDETAMRIGPELVIRIQALFNLIHETRISMSTTDALPFSVKSDLEETRAVLRQGWDELRLRLSENLGWQLKPIPDTAF